MTDISQRVLDQAGAARVAAFFSCFIHGAELNTRQTRSLERIIPSRLILPGLHLEMRLEFLFKLSFHAASMKHRANTKFEVAPIHVRPCPALGRLRPCTGPMPRFPGGAASCPQP